MLLSEEIMWEWNGVDDESKEGRDSSSILDGTTFFLSRWKFRKEYN
jgi:hypothetical protein